MATVRLTPTTYYLSNSTYLSVTDPANMYTNTDSTTYGRVYNSRSSTTTYYIYLRGFDFSQIPAGATVNSFTVKLKAYESGASTSSSYRPYLCNGTSTITSSCNVITTSTQTLSFTGVTATWDTIKSYGSNFGIRISNRRASSGTASYIYIYGAEIEVNYTEQTYDVTVDCTGGTAEPSGVATIPEGSSLTVTATPDVGNEFQSMTINGSAVTPTEVHASSVDNGVALFHLDNNATDALGNATASVGSYSSSSKFGSGCVQLNGSSYITVNLPDNYSPVTVECWFNVTTANASGVYPTLFSTASSSNSGGTYMHIDDGSYSVKCVCRSNASGSSNNTGGYGGTTITRNTWHHFAYCRNGSSHYFFVDGVLQYTVTQSSPNSAQTLYFGGLRGSSAMVSGCYMTGYIDEILVSSACKWTSGFTPPTSAYSSEETVKYTYTIQNIRSNIAVQIVFKSGTATATFYLKSGGAWQALNVKKVYKKVNGAWVEQTDFADVFSTSANYVKG